VPQKARRPLFFTTPAHREIVAVDGGPGGGKSLCSALPITAPLADSAACHGACKARGAAVVWVCRASAAPAGSPRSARHNDIMSPSRRPRPRPRPPGVCRSRPSAPLQGAPHKNQDIGDQNVLFSCHDGRQRLKGKTTSSTDASATRHGLILPMSRIQDIMAT
jgi:hypothetical protein